MINDIKKQAKQGMEKSLAALQKALLRIRSGRAHPSLLDQVMVDCYGTPMPINQVGNVTVSDARTLAVTVWDKNMVQAVEKAIVNAELGLNPAAAGEVVRVPLPPLTEERRKELIRVVKNEVENSRVSIRNVRRDANSHLKELLKAKDISEDEERGAQDDIQKLTDQFISEADKLLAAKEAELMEI